MAIWIKQSSKTWCAIYNRDPRKGPLNRTGMLTEVVQVLFGVDMKVGEIRKVIIKPKTKLIKRGS